LFAGRLAEEKGVRTLLRAWENLPEIPLKIVGHGPLQPLVAEKLSALPSVEYLGAGEHAAVIKLLKQARFLVLPSEWYEGLPMIFIESLACGTPVLASGLGSMDELIEGGINGRLFTAGNVESLVSHAKAMFETGLDMRRPARACYERSYTAERNYDILISIYRNARCSA
jgi:glycosyltransferase involved in cell wall biosynthesis